MSVDPRGSGRVAEYDWIVRGRWNRLHAPADWNDPEYDASDENARTACGLVGWASIPGVFSRLMTPRCAHCCRITGMPRGIGSPKNDDACRALIGLDSGGIDGGFLLAFAVIIAVVLMYVAAGGAR